MAAAAKKEEGNRLFASKDYDGAIRAYTEVRARNARGNAAIGERAMILYPKGDRARARE